MSEYLRLLDQKSLLKDLPLKKYKLKNVEQAFSDLKTSLSVNLTLLEYPSENGEREKIIISDSEIHIDKVKNSKQKIRVGIIGAGSFAKEVHLPNLKRLNDFYEIKAICNKTGISTNTVAKKFSVKKRTSDPNALINIDEIDLVVICTRHNLHGNLVLKCLKSGKHVLVEKPLCTKQSELINIKLLFICKTYPLLMVVLMKDIH